MKKTIYILKIKLKSIFKPIKLEIGDIEHIAKFFSDLRLNTTSDFMVIGPIAFKRDELKYAYYEEKEVK